MTVNFRFWNIRGTNQSPKQKDIKDVINSNNLSLFVVLESQVSYNKLKENCDKIFGSWKWIVNRGISRNTSRIIIGWNPKFLMLT